MNGEDFPLDVPTWYQALQQVGYHTIVVGKDDLTQSLRGTRLDGSRHAAELGIDDWFRMQDKYVTYRRVPWDQFGLGMVTKPCGTLDSGKSNLFGCNDWCYGVFGGGECCTRIANEGYNCPVHDQVGSNQEDYIDNYVTAQAELLLDRAPPGKPWALHVSYPGPHPPFIITEAMNRSISGQSFAASRDNKHVSEADQSQIRQQYAAEIENLDALFGRLLSKVQARGETDRTLVVVTSDHGEQLGDQNAWGKRRPWEPSIRVPLVVSGPDVVANRTVELPVSTLDVIGTFLDRAGASHDNDQFEARSLSPLLRPAYSEEEYLKTRPFAPTGLTYPGRGPKDLHVDFRALIQRVNETHTLKVVCCPRGCPDGNSHVPSRAPLPQLLVFNVAPGAEGDTVNLNWAPEARDLVKQLPGPYATACLDAQIAPPPWWKSAIGLAAPAAVDWSASRPWTAALGALAAGALAAAASLTLVRYRARRAAPEAYRSMACQRVPSESDAEDAVEAES